MLVDTEDLMSSTQVVDTLGISRTRLHQIAEDRGLTRITVGGCHLYLRSEIEHFEKRPNGRPKKRKEEPNV